MSGYDIGKLERLGRRRRKIAAELAEIDAELATEIPAAAAASVPQDKIIAVTGLSRATVQRKELGRRPWRTGDGKES